MNKKSKKLLKPILIINFILILLISIVLFISNIQLKERCEVLCDLNNEAGISLNMCVELVNDLADADINSNFTILNCKEICG